MFFTKAGSFVAWLAFIGGMLKMLHGYILAISGMSPEQIVQEIGLRTTGQYINEGLMVAAAGIGFGIVSEVAKAIIDRARAGAQALEP